ncbi:hypothetical protein [Halomonas sp. HAL1]|uniref:hypothetical protein n=1 Tax=Halomonas sp. HAL1 TaxID=550984 RepID=UPI00022D289C|nr:hypothetical protein [Halomonas sp. HAL1]EHA17055.1 hypothetical protein HAL1_02637 [Halomonas sp. HAL1]WKV92957.1 hypothetical protein Q3Y66_19270 [Halomonas sp. HAL1]
MLLKEMGKKAAVAGISFGLIASPLAMAHSSIELNKDRSAGQDVIDKPRTSSGNTRQPATRDLTRDDGDSLDFSPSSRASDAPESNGSNPRGANISPEDLTREEGDSTDW